MQFKINLVSIQVQNCKWFQKITGYKTINEIVISKIQNVGINFKMVSCWNQSQTINQVSLAQIYFSNYCTMFISLMIHKSEDWIYFKGIFIYYVIFSSSPLIRLLSSKINIVPINKHFPKISHVKTLQNFCKMRYKEQ